MNGAGVFDRAGNQSSGALSTSIDSMIAAIISCGNATQ
jgi:hypothetical protein